jgi:hypothetical protein
MIKAWRLIVVLSGMLMLTACTREKSRYTVINESREDLHRVTVTVSGQSTEFAGLRRGDRRMAAYKTRGDGSFAVRVEYSSGRILEKVDGYVTNGIALDHAIAIGDSDVSVSLASAR